MDVPCPKCNSTDLKKVSLAYEEGLYQSDKRAQFRGVLIASGGPGVLVGTSKTKEQTEGLTAQSAGVGTCRICKNTSALVVLRNIRRSNLRRDGRFLKFAGRTAAKSCGG
jgi:hypothetical protein